MSASGLPSVGLTGADRIGSNHAEPITRTVADARLTAIADPVGEAATRVFRNAPGAGKQTREHVMHVAAELGYRRDERARLLRQEHSRLLGVTLDPAQPFHGETLDGLHTAARERDHDVVLSAFTAHRGEDDALEALLRDRCEALALLGSSLHHGHSTGSAPGDA